MGVVMDRTDATNKIQKMRAELRAEEEKLSILVWLAERKEVTVVQEGDEAWNYCSDKRPYILLGSLHTYSEDSSREKIKAVKMITDGLTDGDIGGYSSPDGSADWAIITVPMVDTKDATIEAKVDQLREYCPEIRVKFSRRTEMVF
jgi:hypothetical protein